MSLAVAWARPAVAVASLLTCNETLKAVAAAGASAHYRDVSVLVKQVIPGGERPARRGHPAEPARIQNFRHNTFKRNVQLVWIVS